MKPPPCSRCRAECCRDVLLQGKEEANLFHPSQVKRLLGDLFMVSGRCPKLSLGNKCSIYEYRPMVCKVIGGEKRPCHRMKDGDKTFHLYNFLSGADLGIREEIG
jgi:hypothetical protein